MKSTMVSALFASLLLVGCSQTSQIDIATKPPWVASYMAGKPTVYYVSTGEKVQSIGKQIAVINPNNPAAQDGPNEWASDKTENVPIEVYAIPGVDVTKVVAVKFAKGGPLIKAVAQNKQP